MALFTTMVHGKNNRKVVFFLAGWKNPLWTYWPITQLLAANGFYCIAYAYDKDVLSSHASQTVTNMNTIVDDVLEKIRILKKQDYTDFSVFGTSLGTIIALIVANKSEDISKIILNTTSADLAATIWSWDRVNPNFKKSLIAQEYTLQTLQKAWSSITPLNNIDNLQNKKILVYLSKKDTLIPFYLGEKLLYEFKKRNYDYKVSINNFLGHVATGVLNLLNVRRYLSFLKN